MGEELMRIRFYCLFFYFFYFFYFFFLGGGVGRFLQATYFSFQSSLFFHCWPEDNQGTYYYVHGVSQCPFVVPINVAAVGFEPRPPDYQVHTFNTARQPPSETNTY